MLRYYATWITTLQASKPYKALDHTNNRPPFSDMINKIYETVIACLIYALFSLKLLSREENKLLFKTIQYTLDLLI